MKRKWRATLGPGFMPVPNGRIEAAVNTMAALIVTESMAAHQTLGTPIVSAPDARQQALREVARKLPAARMVRSLTVRPSRSDSAAYRLGNR